MLHAGESRWQWIRRLMLRRPRRVGLVLARVLALALAGVLVAPVYAAGRQNVQIVWSNEPPLGGYSLGDFDGDGRTDLFRVVGTQWQYSSGGTGPWQNLLNDPTPHSELRFGDFNGDGRTDVFSRTDTGQWRYSPGGSGNWINLASDPTPLADLRFGDFDGDGITDVFSVIVEGSNYRWRFSAGGAGSWQNLAADPTPLHELRFGFFDADDKIDVFSRSGPPNDGRWRFSSGGAGSWQNLAIDPAPLSELALGDFNGDGITDVFHRTSTGQWRYSSGGTAGWVNLMSDPLPLSDLRFGDFDGDGRTDVFSIGPTGVPRYSSGGVAPWLDLVIAPPVLTPTPTPTVLPTAITTLEFGDFDGDGITDVFRTSAGQWQFSPRGVGDWVNLAFDPLPLSELRFGDFNGDRITDVFSVGPDGRWRYSAGGRTNWIDLRQDILPVSELRFGDFNGDGITDVFGVVWEPGISSWRWRFSPGGIGDWVSLAHDPLPLSELRFGDFDGDGRTDVFSVAPDGRWRYSSAGLTSWIELRLDSLPVGELRFGDFDGDGRTDVFSRAPDGRWRYSPAGMGDWVNLFSDPLPLTELRFGDFNGDRRTDVFSIGPDGRWRYSSGGQSAWILLGPPGFVTVTPTPTGSPAAPGCVNILDNGDFETNRSWIFGHSPIPGKYSGAQKKSGLRAVLLGNAPESNEPLKASYSSIRQLVRIPPTAATVTLRWWRLAKSEKGASAAPSATQDRHEVILLTPGGQTLKVLQRMRHNDQTWQTDAVDLTEFAGAAFYIYFNVYNDGSTGRTWMYLDDVRLEICHGLRRPKPGPGHGPGYGPGGPDQSPPGPPDDYYDDPAGYGYGPGGPGGVYYPPKGKGYHPPKYYDPTATPTLTPTPTWTPTPTATPDEENGVGPGGEPDKGFEDEDEPLGARPDHATVGPATAAGDVAVTTPAPAGAPLLEAVSTPRPTVYAPAECIELVNNGNFEATDTGWTILYSPAAPTYVTDITFNRSSQAMRLGIVDGDNRSSISAIDQIVALPADAVSIILSLRYYPILEGRPNAGDFQYVDVYNALTGQFAGRVLGLQSNERAWLTVDYDLTPLAGQSIRLVIAVNNDGEDGYAAMIVDNVSILACTFTNLVKPADQDTPSGMGAAPAAATELAARPPLEPPAWSSQLGAFGVLAGVLAAIGFAVTVIFQTMRQD